MHETFLQLPSECQKAFLQGNTPAAWCLGCEVTSCSAQQRVSPTENFPDRPTIPISTTRSFQPSTGTLLMYGILHVLGSLSLRVR